jgi:hypothetical protein
MSGNLKDFELGKYSEQMWESRLERQLVMMMEHSKEFELGMMSMVRVLEIDLEISSE